MKKYICAVIASLIFCQNVFADDINVKLDGEDVEFLSQSPVIIEGRTLIPLRGVFEKLGYEIGWDNETKTATFVKELTIVKVKVNAPELTVGGKSYSLDVPAQIINGSMMLPLRAVGEATGLEVEWENETKTVILSTEKTDIDVVENKTTAPTETLSSIKTYIDINRANSLAYSYTDQLFDYMSIEEGQDIESLDCETIIKFNEYIIAQSKTISVNKYNKETLEVIRDTAEASTELVTKIKSIVKSSQVGKEFIDEEFNKFSDKILEIGLVIEDSADEYMEYIKEYDWDFDELDAEQKKEVRAFQKQVGAVLDAALKDGIDIDESPKQGAAKIRMAAKEIRENVSKLTPPDFADKDDDILFAGCDVLLEAADLYEQMEENDIRKAYYRSLINTFEFCAKSCAGDYYLIESFD